MWFECKVRTAWNAEYPIRIHTRRKYFIFAFREKFANYCYSGARWLQIARHQTVGDSVPRIIFARRLCIKAEKKCLFRPRRRHASTAHVVVDIIQIIAKTTTGSHNHTQRRWYAHAIYTYMYTHRKYCQNTNYTRSRVNLIGRWLLFVVKVFEILDY